MKQYLELLEDVMRHGERTNDRTGTGTYSVFGRQLRFNLEDGFPLVTTKKVFWRGIVEELLWMLRGDTNVRRLQEKGVHIWDEWADENGELGPVYGRQWREWWVAYNSAPIDQLSNVIEDIKRTPTSRRLIVTAWNPSDVDNMALPPCHCFFQFHVRGGKYLDLQLYQRSADLFLGVPFNIASYSLLLMMVAQECGLIPGEFVHTLGDAHIYLNHIEQVQRQLDRIPLPLPNVTIDNATWDGKRLGIFDLTADNIHLLDYKHYPPISAPVSV